jgi:hypothetical protein
MRQRALFLSAAIVLLVACGAQAMSPFAQRSVARAKTDAARELASVVLPDGARRVQHDPSIGRALGRQAVACTKKYVAEPHGFWRIPGKPAVVAVWLRNHPPRHSRLFGFGTLKHGRTVLAWYIEFMFREQRNVTARVDYMAVRPARAGGTALRVDAVAVGEPHAGQAPCVSSTH